MNPEKIKESINNAIDEFFFKTEDGSYRPIVCIICDSFVYPENMQIISISDIKNNIDLFCCNNINNVSPSLASCYDVSCDETEHKIDISKCLLSPRATYLEYNDKRHTNGYTSCSACKRAIASGSLPKFCIANNSCFGTPPDCLRELTEIELAMITPVKTHGYCFSYTGGVHKQLKGSLTYYKVSQQSIVKTAANFEAFGLNSNIVILIHGNMTNEQYLKARKKSKIRTSFILNAVRWLMLHNEEWIKLNLNFDEVVHSLRSPPVVENIAGIVESTDKSFTSIERMETFQVFFPDGTVSSITGGQNNIEEFQNIVKEATSNGYDIEYRCSLFKEAVSDYKDNNLLNACLLQFPYGRGGMHESRLQADGSITTNVDITEFIQYLSKQSQPQFHTELFTLILYNMAMKQMMVRTAGLKVRNKADANALGNEITMDDVNEAINSSRYRNHSGTTSVSRGKKLLGAVDAIAKSVPHTNESARKARRDAEALQHHFGCPTYFLTVTPDDDNNFLVQIYSDEIIDNDKAVDTLSDQELFERGKKRTELRIKLPGICAYFFELALNIIIKDAIGWDLKNGEPFENKEGLFGNVSAFSISIEEQGRHTLHAHILIWVSEINQIRENLYSSNQHVQRYAEASLSSNIDKIASTRCYFNDIDKVIHSKEFSKAFPHDCTVENPALRKRPKIVEDQELRHLRYKNTHDNIFAYCQDCTKTWTTNEFLNSYLTNMMNIKGFSGLPDSEIKRLKSLAIENQKNQEEPEIKRCIIDAGYNFHCHTKSCFEFYKVSGVKRKCNDNCECRYRYPQRKKQRTSVQNASDEPISWFLWHGVNTQRHIKELCMKRHSYDAFQNVYCPAISYSKLTCNTNISFVMPGPVAQYCFNYNTKGTQKMDTEEYERVKSASQKILSKVRKHEKNSSEAVRRLLYTSFAHQSTNVLGASLASFLTRNGTRFMFSHKFAWVPMRDLKSLLHGNKVATMLSIHNNMTFFQCAALHYLCRPLELEDLSAFDFFSFYEVVRVSSRNKDELLTFVNTELYIHPSFSKKSKTFKQGVRLRERSLLVKIYQYDFPDSSNFQSSLLDENCSINSVMEEYSELALLLFHPYRNLYDLLLTNSYVRKLQYAMLSGVIGEKQFQFLQNIQDCKSNSHRITIKEDDLQRVTKPLHAIINEEENYEEDGDEQNNINSLLLDEFLNMIDEEETERDCIQSNNTFPATFSCKTIRNKGRLKCGYDNMPVLNTEDLNTQHLLEVSADLLQPNLNENNCDDALWSRPNDPSQQQIVTIIFAHKTKQTRSFNEITNNDILVSVREANGSAKSIIDWAVKANLDKQQRRAFEVLAGSFVLSYFNAATQTTCSQVRHSFLLEKRRLQILVDEKKRKSKQLIGFLHGPAGSGKTTVIDLVVCYGKEYCGLISGTNDSGRSIVVTAMTGVAATLLLGETTHSAVYLNQKRPINGEQVELWKATKMLVIDEISFANKEDIQMLHKRLRKLKQKLELKFGGIHIVFVGDMRQLEPVKRNKKPLYAENIPEFKDWVNCYMEIGGIHRFRDDPEWGALLMRFRNGEATISDIRKINKRIKKTKNKVPQTARYATYFNMDRDAINTALFEERAKQHYHAFHHTNGFIMIFSDNVEVKNSMQNYIPLKNKKHFWENCGEDDVILPKGKGRMDPVLKLFAGCRVMLPTNINVKAGQANGTQATVEKVFLKPNEKHHFVYLDNKIPIMAVMASQIDYIELKHTNLRVNTKTFQIRPKKHTFKAKLSPPISIFTKKCRNKTRKNILQMRATQVPLLLNNATTGHKLQGSGVDMLFVHNWSYVTNWVYVILSRVKTLNGLFGRMPLSEDLSKYAVPTALTKMISKFVQLSPTEFTTDQYYLIAESPYPNIHF